MIVSVQIKRKRKPHVTWKPFRGNFYSQWTHDMIGGKFPPRMSEEELCRQIYFGNIHDPSAFHFAKKLAELNSARGDQEREEEFYSEDN